MTKDTYRNITIARKPLIGSIVENITLHNTGGINIDHTRIGTEQRTYKGSGVSSQRYADHRAGLTDGRGRDTEYVVNGRWSANVLLSESAVSCFPIDHSDTGRVYSYAGREYSNCETSMFNGDKPQAPSNYGDSGSASRYFKVVKEND